jgi:uroporphyrinogen-III synthase
MRVLVTRPAEDAIEIAADLAARGHQALVAPLLEIRDRRDSPLVCDDVQAVLVTSRNGVRAFSRRTARRDLPILAVGRQTAAEARALGFPNVRDAGGDARALAGAVLDWAKPDAGVLLHAAGAERSADLAVKLGVQGYCVRTITLYEAIQAATLPPAVRSALQEGSLDAVLNFSPRSARILVERLTDEGLAPACRKIVACAISAAAAEPLRALPFRSIRWAPSPDRESLLSLLA